MPFTDMKLFFEKPLVLNHSNGNYVYDTDGNEYLDCISSLWHVGVGHRNKFYLDRLSAQMSNGMTSSSLFGSVNTVATQLASDLVDFIDEPGLEKVFLSSGGSEAVETALKMAIKYNKIRGRKGDKIVYLKNGYHGVSLGALSAMGIEGDRIGFEAYLSREFVAMESPHCYRCPYGLEHPSCQLRCAASLQELIDKNNGEITTLIVEPVQGAGGIIVPPPGYLMAVHRICAENDIVTIFDEVVTGFWRAGEIFAFKDEQCVPDILVLSKGMSGGVLPLGATVAKQEIFDTFALSGQVFMHGNTYSGNPLCCAAGIAHLEFITEPKVVEDIKDLVKVFGKKLESLRQFSIVGDVRCKGLMAGVELVVDKQSKEPYRSRTPLALQAREHGLLLRPLGNVITLFPMLTSNEVVIQDMFNRFNEFLGSLEILSSRRNQQQPIQAVED